MNKEREKINPSDKNGNSQGEMNIRKEADQGGMTQAELLEEIRQLSFVKNELELYLDTHPTCRQALDYYYQTVDALNNLMMRYHEIYGPILASGVTSSDSWTWVEMPWPWQVGNGAPEKRGKR